MTTKLLGDIITETKNDEKSAEPEKEKTIKILKFQPGYIKANNTSYMDDAKLKEMLQKFARSAANIYNDETLTNNDYIINVVVSNQTGKVYEFAFIFIKESEPGNRLYNLLVGNNMAGEIYDEERDGEDRPILPDGILSPSQVDKRYTAVKSINNNDMNSVNNIRNRKYYDDYRSLSKIIKHNKDNDKVALGNALKEFFQNLSIYSKKMNEEIPDRIKTMIKNGSVNGGDDVDYIVNEILADSAANLYKTTVSLEKTFVQEREDGTIANRLITIRLNPAITAENLRLQFVPFTTTEGSFTGQYGKKEITGPYPHVWIEKNKNGDNIGNIVFSPTNYDASYALHMRKKVNIITTNENGQQTSYEIVVNHKNNQRRVRKGLPRTMRSDNRGTSAPTTVYAIRPKTGKTFTKSSLLKDKTSEPDSPSSPSDAVAKIVPGFSTKNPFNLLDGKEISSSGDRSSSSKAVSVWSKPLPKFMLEADDGALVATKEAAPGYKVMRGYDPDRRDDGNLPRFF